MLGKLFGQATIFTCKKQAALEAIRLFGAICDDLTLSESKRCEKAWYVEERSYGSLYRSTSLPFTPADGAVEAHLDKGVLHVTVKRSKSAASI